MCVRVCTANRHTVLTPVENMVLFDNKQLKEAHCYRTGCNLHRDCKGLFSKCMKEEPCSFGICRLNPSQPLRSVWESPNQSLQKPRLLYLSPAGGRVSGHALTTLGRCCHALPCRRATRWPGTFGGSALGTDRSLARRADRAWAQTASGSRPILSPEHLWHRVQFQLRFFTGLLRCTPNGHRQ